MLGTVISADMDLIGQLQPHQPTRFVKVNMETALKARAERKARAGRLKESLS
jgi:allophanate hydrolase subunit 2